MSARSKHTIRPLTTKNDAAKEKATGPNKLVKDLDDVNYTVSLPKIEIAFYFAVWIGHVSYSYYAVYHASITYRAQLPYYYFTSGNSWLRREKDVSNLEWYAWLVQAKTYLPWYLVHSLLFNVTAKPLGNMWKHTMFCYWLLANYFIYNGTFALAITAAHGIIMFLIGLLRCKALVWIAAISQVAYVTQDWVYGSIPFTEVYSNMVFFAYKMIQYISYTLHTIDNPSLKDSTPWWTRLYNMFWYSFYMPYNVTLIVLYDEFLVQFENRVNQNRDWFSILWKSLRIGVWTALNEIILHFCYFNALIVSPAVLEAISKTDLSVLASVGFTAGQFFQTKYVSIFGFPGIFATIDRMKPPGTPICISRVALYSRMWRYFDRGLYTFLKRLIFLPLVQLRPASLTWRLVATAACFLFIYVWHGATKFYLVWVSFNFVEILLETAAKECWTAFPSLREFVLQKLGQRWLRRIVALGQFVCVSLGILGIFYFIGGYESGYFFLKDIYVVGLLYLKRPFFHVAFLGYCFSQCCIEIERLEREYL